MGRHLLGRILQLVPVLLLISAVVFVIMHVLPGDPAELMLSGAEGGAITPQRLAELKQEMGLNDPLPVQFGHFLTGAVVGDLGQSVRYRVSVTSLILDGFGATLSLSVCGLIVSVLIGVPLGMAASLRQNSWLDTMAMAWPRSAPPCRCIGWGWC